MKVRYRNFFLILTALLAIETLFLYAMLQLTEVGQNVRFVLVITMVFLLVIPMNIFVAWKLAMRE